MIGTVTLSEQAAILEKDVLFLSGTDNQYMHGKAVNC